MDIFLVILSVIKILIVIQIMLALVSYSVMAERRVSAMIQDRIGPNRTGIPLGGLELWGIKIPQMRIWGLGQPIADALKFMLKEEFTPAHVNHLYFWLAPTMAMVPALLTIGVVPYATLDPVNFFGWEVSKVGVIADVNVGILFVFAIASLGVYGIVIAGWASNSKYPFLGGIRSSAQMISYEIAMGLSVIPIFLVTGNLNLSGIVNYQIEHGWLALPFVVNPHHWTGADAAQWVRQSLLLWPCLGFSFLIFMVAAFAETNRLPFDLPESESELVGGYHTEYSAMKFALFFLGEYAAMIVASCLMVTLFFGGWSLPFHAYNHLPETLANHVGVDWSWLAVPIQGAVFLAKMAIFIVFFIFIRWTLPRFRYDQLMNLGWKVFLPLALANIVVAALLVALGRTG